MQKYLYTHVSFDQNQNLKRFGFLIKVFYMDFIWINHVLLHNTREKKKKRISLDIYGKNN